MCPHAILPPDIRRRSLHERKERSAEGRKPLQPLYFTRSIVNDRRLNASIQSKDPDKDVFAVWKGGEPSIEHKDGIGCQCLAENSA
jgi:hypothetical protein